MAIRTEGDNVILDMMEDTTSLETMKVCLEYMCRVARNNGYLFTARFISMAIAACDDEMADAASREGN